MADRLTKSAIDKALPSEHDYFRWDGELKGFGIKVAKGGRKSYVCKYRVGNGRTSPTRRMTIGAHGSRWTVEQAHIEARKLLGRAANGEDLAKEKQDEKRELTLAELCDRYLDDHSEHEHLVTYKGKHVESVKRAWRLLRADVGLDDQVNPYSLRHTVARWLRKEGVPAWEVAAQLGHKRLEFTTTEIYAPFDPSYLSNAVEGIDKLLQAVSCEFARSALLAKSSKPL